MTRKILKNKVDIEYGKFVRALRRRSESHLSAEFFLLERYDLLDISKSEQIGLSTLKNIESGSTTISITSIIKLATLFGLDPIDLFDPYIEIKTGDFDRDEYITAIEIKLL